MLDISLTAGLVIGVMFAALIAVVAWAMSLRAGRSAARERADEQRETAEGHRADLLAVGQDLQQARVRVAELETAASGFEQRLADQQAGFQERVGGLRDDFAKRLKQFRRVRDREAKRAENAFSTLANQALTKASGDFLRLAETKFEGEQQVAQGELDKRRVAIEKLLEPINKTLEKHERAVSEIEVKREGSYAKLEQQLAAMSVAQMRLQSETGNLVKALRRPEVRGRWGEMQLRRVAEVAGMISHCDFDEQVTVSDGRRPDMVVRLPADRSIVVDAKNTIDAYLSALEAQGDDERERYLIDHVGQLEQQVGALATKGYQSQFERSPDFVVLFVPVESALQAALERKPGLLESAMTRGVVIATPSTLIALLKAVAMGWREEKVAENAQRISDLGQELHKRVGDLVGHVEKLGGSLDSAVKHYNKAVGSLDTRVLVTTRKFKELGADSAKELPAEGEVKLVESSVREVKAVEAE
jgi:DNA recombination protein RmuC